MIPPDPNLLASIASLLKDGTFWSAVSALATIAGAGAIFFAARQFRFEAMMKAHEIFNASDFAEDRGQVFGRLDKPPEGFTAEERANALSVLRRLDEFARLAPFIGQRRLDRIWGDPMAKTWLLLEPIVREERVKAHWPEKWDALEEVGRRALRSRPHLLLLPGAPATSTAGGHVAT